MLTLLIPACSSSAASADLPTIAFLRAVPGSTPQERIIELLAVEGFEVGRDLEVLAADPSEVYPMPEDARAAVRGWVEAGVDLIVAQSSVGASVAASEAPEATIVFLVNDPMAVGLVSDEQHPEGRLTGVTFRVPADRTLVAAREAIGTLDRVGLLYPSQDPAALPHRDAVVQAGRRFGIRIVPEPFDDESDVTRAVDALAEAKVQAILVSNSPTAVRMSAVIGPAISAHRLPVIANTDRFPDALVVLQPDVPRLIEQLSRQVVRLLRGASPADVPVEDPHLFELVLNEAAAQALGITFSEDLVRQATRVVR